MRRSEPPTASGSRRPLRARVALGILAVAVVTTLALSTPAFLLWLSIDGHLERVREIPDLQPFHTPSPPDRVWLIQSCIENYGILDFGAVRFAVLDLVHEEGSGDIVQIFGEGSKQSHNVSPTGFSHEYEYSDGEGRARFWFPGPTRAASPLEFRFTVRERTLRFDGYALALEGERTIVLLSRTGRLLRVDEPPLPELGKPNGAGSSADLNR